MNDTRNCICHIFENFSVYERCSVNENSGVGTNMINKHPKHPYK